jgi:Cu-processing system permease protein
MTLELKPVLVIARKEFWDRVRSRWVLAVAVIFTAFALVIAYFGTATEGAVGFRGMDVTIASLVSLAIYLVPLISLLLGFDTVIGERERGSLDLLLSMPITRLELLLGKYLGLAAALAFSTIAGFGLVGILISYGVGAGALLRYGMFMLTTLGMGFAFLSLAVLVSVWAPNKVIASGAAVVLWFFYVLVFDLLLMGILVATQGRYVGDVFPILLLLNPADIYRILNVFGMQDLRALYGLATVMPEGLASPGWMGLAMTFWIAAPLAAAYFRLRSNP